MRTNEMIACEGLGLGLGHKAWSGVGILQKVALVAVPAIYAL